MTLEGLVLVRSLITKENIETTSDYPSTTRKMSGKENNDETPTGKTQI